MQPTITLKELAYLCLALTGLIATWYFNIQFYSTAQDTSLGNFIAQTVTTVPAKSISADISVVAITFLVWMVLEAKKIKLKHWWLFLPLTFLVALAFSFPLFLFFRERRLRKLRLGKEL